MGLKGGDLGSIITISGPLLSYPTLSALIPTPLLIAHNVPPSESALPVGALAAFRKAFKNVVEVQKDRKEPGMPSSREGWEPIMRFWSEHLGRRQSSGLYEVMSGVAMN